MTVRMTALPEEAASTDRVLGATPARPIRKRDAARAFGVTFGGSTLLVAGSVASIAATLRRLAKRESPPPLALAGTGLTALYISVLRPWCLRWGSRPAEGELELPGDDMLPRDGRLIQHAVTIEARPEQVWPWLAQIGQDRGGFYSYEWLENLAGCEMRNADAIHPEWQLREPGEPVPLHPAVGLEVAVFDPPRAIGLRNWGNWVLVDEAGGRTRLIARGRLPTGLPGLAYALLMEIPHFLMQRRMLLGIKARAEHAPNHPNWRLSITPL